MCISSVYKSRKETIDLLYKLKDKKIDITQFWNSWNTAGAKIGKFIRVQKGAGNGKTYQLWKSICENATKTLFLMLTKPNSAVRVLYEELEAQRKRQCEHLIDMVDLEIKPYAKTNSTKYIIKYKHRKTAKPVVVIIGTVDSFSCSLRALPHNVQNKFIKLQEELYKDGPSKMKKSGAIKYGGENIKLNKKCQIWIDEAQDLPMNYFNAFVTLMRHTGIDVGMVGDKMQSISYGQNVFTKLNEDIKSVQEGIELIDIKPENINRRIKSKYLAKAINEYVRFEEFESLPIQNTEKDGDDNELQDNGSQEEVFFVFSCPIIYANDSVEEKEGKSGRFADILVSKIKNEIKKYNWLPNNFLINSIIVSGKPELHETESKIQDMWEEIFEDKEYRNKIPEDNYWKKNNHVNSPNKAVKYVQFHRSENGQPINLSESEYKTRITSTFTAKGMGREIVFTVGVTESSLKICANHIKKLRYESLFHVSVSRAKIRQYFQLTPNNDDIHRRFYRQKGVFYIPKINSILNLNKVASDADKSLFIKLLTENGINENMFKESEKKRNIDFNHHITRDSAWKTLIFYKICHNQMDNEEYMSKSKGKGQIQTMFNKICVPIKEYTTKPYFEYLTSFTGLKGYNKDFKHIPVLYKARNDAYKKHTNIMKKHILHVKKNILNLSDLKKPLDYIIFCHLLSLIRHKKYAEPDVNSLYQVIDIFTANEKEEQKEFYNQLKDVNKIIDSFIGYLNRTYDYLDWNILHKVTYDGGSNEFVLLKKSIPLIGYNEDTVIHVVLKPTANTINFWDIMTDVLLQRFMISNPKGNEGKLDNFDRYHNKELKTFIIVLETGEIIPFDNDFHQNFSKEIILFLKESIIRTFDSSHRELYAYASDVRGHYRNEKKEKTDSTSISKVVKKGDGFQSFATPWEWLEHMSGEKKYPQYIIHFFKNINKLWRKKKKEEVRKLFDSEEEFTNELNEELIASLNKFFRIVNENDDDDDF